MTKHAVEIVRANNVSSPQHDDDRVLAYRLGPRGQTKAAVHYDEWTGDTGPNSHSNPLLRYCESSTKCATFNNSYS